MYVRITYLCGVSACMCVGVYVCTYVGVCLCVHMYYVCKEDYTQMAIENAFTFTIR